MIHPPVDSPYLLLGKQPVLRTPGRSFQSAFVLAAPASPDFPCEFPSAVEFQAAGLLISRPLCKKEALLCIPHLQIWNEWQLIEIGLTQSPICLSNLKEIWRSASIGNILQTLSFLALKWGALKKLRQLCLFHSFYLGRWTEGGRQPLNKGKQIMSA